MFRNYISILLTTMLLVFISTHASAFENYFPKGALDKEESLDNFIQEWYAKHLHSMEEPTLFRRKKGVVYRFTWLRTFHEPMSFRFQTTEKGRSQLVVKKTDGHGGYEAGKITINKTIHLNQEQSDALLTLINKQCGFWDMPSHIKVMGLDGARWILEGNKNGHYHMADRFSPKSGCMFEIGKMFMDLSGVKIKKIY